MSSSEWLAEQVRLALLHPRRFAQALTSEHFGLAPVIVALASAACWSLALDLLVIASRGLDPLPFIPRLLVDALFVSARVAVVIAVLGFVGARVLRLVRGNDAPSLEELVSGIAFALVPFLVAFPIAALAAIAPLLGVVATVALLIVAGRVVYGLALTMGALLPRATATVSLAILLATGGYAVQDQISRAAFVTYTYLPQLAPPLAAEPATGTRFERFGVALTLPERWRRTDSAIAGEIVRFETDKDSLVATSHGGGVFLTPGDLADDVALGELRGMTDRASRRQVVRIGGMLVVDDRHAGVYEGRRVAVRQFTSVRGTVAYALVFRSIEPTDTERSFAEDASIAATWRLGSP